MTCGAEPEMFRSAQAALPACWGTVNTAVLLTGSWLAARAVRTQPTGKPRPWPIVTALFDLMFIAIKLFEYVHIFELGITLPTNAFGFSYLFLTTTHQLQLLVGVAILGEFSSSTISISMAIFVDEYSV
ncbi:MAG: nitric oxide reductase NorE protein [Myxococcota bacterium]|jgi:nitric oxide reductase NorE protein